MEQLKKEILAALQNIETKMKTGGCLDQDDMLTLFISRNDKV